jgi:hypothetical protein
MCLYDTKLYSYVKHYWPKARFHKLVTLCSLVGVVFSVYLGNFFHNQGKICIATKQNSNRFNAWLSWHGC